MRRFIIRFARLFRESWEDAWLKLQEKLPLLSPSRSELRHWTGPRRDVRFRNAGTRLQRRCFRARNVTRSSRCTKRTAGFAATLLWSGTDLASAITSISPILCRKIVAELRHSAYPHLAEVANHWAEALGEKAPRYPREHEAFLKICHKAGQDQADAADAAL